MADSPEPSPPNRKPSQSNSYLKYGGLAFQLLAAIALLGWIGHLIDGRLGLKYPVFMLMLGFLGFGGMMYQVYRSLNNN